MKTICLLTCLVCVVLIGCSMLSEPGQVETIHNPDGTTSSFTNGTLSKKLVDAVHAADSAASAAGVPWAHTAAEGFLGGAALAVTWWNRNRRKKLIEEHTQTKDALKAALGRLQDTEVLTRQDR